MIARCPACAQLFPVLGSARMACPFCGAPVQVTIERQSLDAPASSSAAPRDRTPLPWEDDRAPRTFTQLPRRFFATLGALLRSPRAALDRAAHGPHGEDVRSALSFALFALAPALLLLPAVCRATLAPGSPVAELLAELFGRASAHRLASAAPALPVFLVAAVVFAGSTYQLASTLFTGHRPSVARTVRATCFGLAPMIFAPIPLAGLPVAIGWSLALHVLGLRALSGLGRTPSILVVLAPLLVIAGSFVYG